MYGASYKWVAEAPKTIQGKWKIDKVVTFSTSFIERPGSISKETFEKFKVAILGQEFQIGKDSITFNEKPYCTQKNKVEWAEDSSESQSIAIDISSFGTKENPHKSYEETWALAMKSCGVPTSKVPNKEQAARLLEYTARCVDYLEEGNDYNILIPNAKINEDEFILDGLIQVTPEILISSSDDWILCYIKI